MMKTKKNLLLTLIILLLFFNFSFSQVRDEESFPEKQGSEGIHIFAKENFFHKKILDKTVKLKSSHSQTTAVNQQDSLALVALYNACGGTNWTNNSNWLNGAVNSWYGVTVDSGRVTTVDLRGSSDSELFGLSGQLPAELGNLTGLDSLILTYNSLSGTIPASLGNLVNLKILEIWKNQLTGSIPPELGQLTNLKTLDIGFNQLTGIIPVELGQLKQLENLWMNDLQLTGNIPVELSQLSKLKILAISNNKLTGNIPSELDQLSNLQLLYLTQNQLTGSIPPELGDLSSLERLYLNSNQLNSSIPPELGRLTSLISIFIGNNLLHGQIPSELGQLSNLQYLNLYNGQSLSGEIPPELGNLSNLKRLTLSFNQLSGTIPVELGQLLNLERMYLWSNLLEGGIPVELGNLSRIRILSFGYNKLSGSIPDELGQLEYLNELYLNNNQLTGTLPHTLGNLQNLSYLDLSENLFGGTIAESLNNLIWTETLLLNGNNFDSLPYFTDLINAGNMSKLNVSDNKLTFEDIEPYAYWGGINYSPQQNIGKDTTINVEPGKSYTLSISCGGTNNLYQWFKDGAAIAVAQQTPDILVQSFSASDEGQYMCNVTNTVVPDLTIESNVITLKESINTSNTIIDHTREVVVYPNPTSGFLTLKGLPTNQKSNIRICNLKGNILKEIKASPHEHTIDLREFQSGTYLILLDKELSESVKIIKR